MIPQGQPSVRAAPAALGLAEAADRGSVVRPYRRLARATHPDRSDAPDATASIAAITAAYHQAAYHRALDRTDTPEQAEAVPGASTVGVRVSTARTGPVGWFAPPGAVCPPLSRWLGSGAVSDPPIVAGPVRIHRPPTHPHHKTGSERGVMADLGRGRALYSISVASELTGVNPQVLRAYESKGLLNAFRTEGGTRRYSGGGLDRIGEITDLLAAGLHLAGAEQVLALRAETLRLRQRSTGSGPGCPRPTTSAAQPGGSRPPRRSRTRRTDGLLRAAQPLVTDPAARAARTASPGPGCVVPTQRPGTQSFDVASADWPPDPGWPPDRG